MTDTKDNRVRHALRRLGFHDPDLWSGKQGRFPHILGPELSCESVCVIRLHLEIDASWRHIVGKKFYGESM